jgi:ATP-binding cassette subfamily B protein
VLNADTIVVLEKGRIAAQGKHRELMESSEIYAEIYRSQLVEDPVATQAIDETQVEPAPGAGQGEKAL